ncbi:E3 ubiquitin/ISG15 ligase TRIM25-like [Chanos chanos]|uniref:E3 ubiquitin/ISG15 ligase TRIM25-like n=1 Tax=Chanos chanos TaxID=29144 RepID=A0A6J2WZK5_CHACN|nr:E3 ubiquitin/ISG15 ligase TRIM25-like [Chanos chanos]
MAEASLSAEESLMCPICLDLLKDPATIACGHSYCMCCIKSFWDQDDQKGAYSCPQCRETFASRPVLKKNTMLAELAEKLRKTRLQGVLSPDSYAKPGDVECDVCTARKLKAVKSCLVCLISFCETHLQTHLESPAYEKHRLVEASTKLQHKICPQHDKLLEIYCRTDRKMICYLCVMYEHKGHDTVSAAAERADKQRQLEETLRNSQQRIRRREEELQELKQVVNSLKFSAQTAVEDSVKIFTEMLRSIERKCSEVKEWIRVQEKAELSQVEGQIKKLEQELADLRKRDSELEQLSHTEDHIHFLQDFQSLSVCSGYKDSPSIIIKPVSSFDDVKKSVSEVKIKLEEFLSGDVIKASGKDSGQVTLGASMACKELRLSEENSKVTWSPRAHSHSDPSQRFDRNAQAVW